MLSQCPTYFLPSRIHYSVLHVMGVFVNFSDRFLPDKAIDLVDEAGSRVRLRHAQLPEEARELNKELRQITKEKNEAVRSQDFEKVQEAASGSVFVQMPGVWINLAHVHFAQGNFPLAVKMYQNCLRKLYYSTNSQVLLYLARTHYEAEQLQDCKKTLLRAIHLAPSNYTLKFDAGVAMQKFSASTLQKQKRTVDEDIAGTLATEEAEDSAQVAKLRSALESVDHKRRKILQQMRSDVALLTLEDGGSPVRNPSTAAEDARLASLISLDGILKQVKDITRQSSVSTLGRSKKRVLLASLDGLAERMPSLLDIDHPCAQRHIADARRLVESIPEDDGHLQETSQPPKLSDLGSDAETDVAQWNVLQFNTGSTTPFIIKCGANSNSELVIKAEARVQEPKGGEIVRVVPRPTILENMSLEEMKQVFSQLPEALTLLALARTADGTRARYSRLYRTLAMKVPALRDLVGELEKGGVLKDVRP